MCPEVSEVVYRGGSSSYARNDRSIDCIRPLVDNPVASKGRRRNSHSWPGALQKIHAARLRAKRLLNQKRSGVLQKPCYDPSHSQGAAPAPDIKRRLLGSGNPMLMSANTTESGRNFDSALQTRGVSFHSGELQDKTRRRALQWANHMCNIWLVSRLNAPRRNISWLDSHRYGCGLVG